MTDATSYDPDLEENLLPAQLAHRAHTPGISSAEIHFRCRLSEDREGLRDHLVNSPYAHAHPNAISVREEEDMIAGNLCEDKPIRLERVEPVPPQGTRIEVTFDTETPLHEELERLREVLERYVRLLPIDIIFSNSAPRDGQRKVIRLIRESWAPCPAAFGRMYTFQAGGMQCETAIDVGPAFHEVYQNRVLVSSRYNLLSHGLKEQLQIPHLGIRLDSPDFELPFGRHYLRDEDVLTDVARYLRWVSLFTYCKRKRLLRWSVSYDCSTANPKNTRIVLSRRRVSGGQRVTELVISESVPHSPDRFDEVATLSELFSQAHNLNINGALGYCRVVSFDRSYYLVPTEHPSRMFRQEVKDLEFSHGQIHQAVSERNPKT